VKNLTFSGEAVWTGLDQKFAGTISPAAAFAAVAKPGAPAVYELKDQNTVSVLVRAQRNF
jgi:hypothetical protein